MYYTEAAALAKAKKETGALRISPASDGVNLRYNGYGMYGVRVFSIYRTFDINLKECFMIRYADV